MSLLLDCDNELWLFSIATELSVLHDVPFDRVKEIILENNRHFYNAEKAVIAEIEAGALH